MLTDQMRLSTSKDTAANAEAASHKLLLQAGYIIQHGSGIYSIGPLGMRVMKKIETTIVREMENIGAQYVQMPIMQPSALWKQSGRWEQYKTGGELFTVTDRKKAEYSLAPTAEEIATVIAARTVKSPKQLPYAVFQIGQKFRDEIRPRHGLMRTKEFVMMDGYSFDKDVQALDTTYKATREAYFRIFESFGLDFRPVVADTGAMGGAVSEEFMALADIGEDTILYSENYAANIETAVSTIDVKPRQVALPISVSSDITNLDEERLLTGQFFKTSLGDDADIVYAIVRAGDDINNVKLKNILKVDDVYPVKDADCFTMSSMNSFDIENVVHIVVDVTACFTNASLIFSDDTGVNNMHAERDIPIEKLLTADIRIAKEGEIGPDGTALMAAKGIEIGHIFQLGNRYAKALGATYQENNAASPFEMGCYGIGLSRTMAAIVEQQHDDNGICWPPTVAPFDAMLIPVKYDDDETQAIAHQVHDRLQEGGIDVLMDTRDVRPGIKFNDADLIGMPVVITLGRDLKDNKVEVKIRKTGERQLVDINIIDADYIRNLHNTISTKLNPPKMTL